MSAKTSGTSGGIGFGGALALLFIGLKLGGAIDWSWWWVLCPLWLPVAVGVVVAIISSLIRFRNNNNNRVKKQ